MVNIPQDKQKRAEISNSLSSGVIVLLRRVKHFLYLRGFCKKHLICIATQFIIIFWVYDSTQGRYLMFFLLVWGNGDDNVYD